MLSEEEVQVKYKDFDLKDMENFIYTIMDERVFDEDGITQKVAYGKYTDHCTIQIDCTSDIMEEMPEEVAINIFDDIENRIQRTEGYGFYVLFHRVSDNKILKSSLYDQNVKEVEELLNSCIDEHVYDVVINAGQKLPNVGKIKIRYLNYCLCESKDEITLQYPEYLIGASLMWVRIDNIRECSNLRNVYSYQNSYKQGDIDQLSQIKRFDSINETYESNEGSLLEELFKNSKPEYVSFESHDSSKNIIKSTVLSKNISQLRFIHIGQTQAKGDIKLDISSEFPDGLTVYDVKINRKINWQDPDDLFVNVISGPEQSVTRLQENLIHKIE